MLIIARKLGEAVNIGDVRIEIVSLGVGQVRLGIEAPRDMAITREEMPEKHKETIYERAKNE